MGPLLTLSKITDQTEIIAFKQKCCSANLNYFWNIYFFAERNFNQLTLLLWVDGLPAMKTSADRHQDTCYHGLIKVVPLTPLAITLSPSGMSKLQNKLTRTC